MSEAPTTEHQEGFDEDAQIHDHEIIELTDEDGNTQLFALIAVIEDEGVDYAMMASVEQLEDDESDELEFLIFEYTQTPEGHTFKEIEDEDVYQRVADFCATLVNQVEE